MAFSKTRVDRAGREFCGIVERIIKAPGRLSDGERKTVAESIEAIEWWRREHAKPLSRVAANLRYYAAQRGRPVVAQRLKKVPTMTAKLMREESMRLTQMADVGGVRAVLPDLEATQHVATRLRRNWTIIGGADYVKSPKPDGYRAIH